MQGSTSASTPPALKIKSGQTVKIDTLNSTELNRDDYLQVLESGGVSPSTPFIRETLDILSVPPSTEPAARNARVVGRLLTGPVYVEGAEPGDTLEVRVLDVAVQSDFGINRTITNMGHPFGDDHAGADGTRLQARSQEQESTVPQRHRGSVLAVPG